MRRTDWKTHRLPKSGRVLTVAALSVKAENPGMALLFAIPQGPSDANDSRWIVPIAHIGVPPPNPKEIVRQGRDVIFLTYRHLGTGRGYGS